MRCLLFFYTGIRQKKDLKGDCQCECIGKPGLTNLRVVDITGNPVEDDSMIPENVYVRK